MYFVDFICKTQDTESKHNVNYTQPKSTQHQNTPSKHKVKYKQTKNNTNQRTTQSPTHTHTKHPDKLKYVKPNIHTYDTVELIQNTTHIQTMQTLCIIKIQTVHT